MSSTWKTNLLKYGISSAVGFLMVLLYFCLHLDSLGDFAELESVDQYLMICDAFTVPGVLILMMGCLVSLSNEGAFNGVSYVVSFAVRSLIPGLGGHERYNEYLERKSANRVKGYAFLYIVGAVFLAVALAFMALYYLET